MKRHFALALVLAIGTLPLQSATLERLTLDDMITQSTAIVRGKVTGSYSAFSGPVIYTHYAVQVAEVFKGSGDAAADVACPGGSAKGLQQTFAGSPELLPGQEYVLFLWTGKSGLTQVIGFSQGVFFVENLASGAVVKRDAARAPMAARGTGLPVRDDGVNLSLSELRQRIATALGGGAQ